MELGLVTLFGGSGFLGRHLIQQLAREGATIRVAVRDPERAKFLKTMGEVGQIQPLGANLRDDRSVARAVEGADVVVNLVGILFESGRQTFEAVHVEGAARVAKAAKDAGARRVLQVSAIGADPDSPSAYARTKAAGEAAVREAFAEATIVKPSVVFGPEDDFINRFAMMARTLPVLPVFYGGLPKIDLFKDFPWPSVEFGAGETRMQPVYVGDVAAAMSQILLDPKTKGKTYEFGGPTVYRLAEIMELVCRQTGRRRPLLPIPFALAQVLALFLELLPVPPLTRDQLKLLKIDSVVGPDALTLSELGVEPTALEVILPTYVGRSARARPETEEASHR